MTEVFRSDAKNALTAMLCQILLTGFSLAFALIFFSVASAQPFSVWWGCSFAALTIFCGFKADRNYVIVQRYIMYPPNCVIREVKSDAK